MSSHTSTQTPQWQETRAMLARRWAAGDRLPPLVDGRRDPSRPPTDAPRKKGSGRR